MPTRAPTLLPLFRSDNQLRLLGALLLHPDRRYTVTELAEQTGVPQPTVSREVEKLRRAALVSDELDRGRRVVRANTEAAIYPELAALLVKVLGPRTVLERLLAEVPGIERAAIYGSWARRYAGESGEQPGDVDVLVVGEPDVAKVRRAADRASRELGRDVEVTVLTPREWAAARSGFVRRLHESPLVELTLRTAEAG